MIKKLLFKKKKTIKLTSCRFFFFLYIRLLSQTKFAVFFFSHNVMLSLLVKLWRIIRSLVNGASAKKKNHVKWKSTCWACTVYMVYKKSFVSRKLTHSVPSIRVSSIRSGRIQCVANRDRNYAGHTLRRFSACCKKKKKKRFLYVCFKYFMYSSFFSEEN